MCARSAPRSPTPTSWPFRVARAIPFYMRPAPRRGLSLLEVILAIAILGGALVTIGQLIRIGARSAGEARDLTMSQLYAESEMNGIAAGWYPLDNVTDEKYDDLGNYVYSVNSAGTERTGVMQVTVTVKPAAGTTVHPVSYALTRWIVEPDYAQQLADQEAAMKQAFKEIQDANTNAQTSGTSTAGAGGASSATSVAAAAGAGAAATNALGGGQGGKAGNQQGKGQQGKGGNQQGKGGNQQ